MSNIEKEVRDRINKIIAENVDTNTKGLQDFIKFLLDENFKLFCYTHIALILLIISLCLNIYFIFIR